MEEKGAGEPCSERKGAGLLGEMMVAVSKYSPGVELFALLLRHRPLATVSCLVRAACLVAPGLLKAALSLHGFATFWVHPSRSASPICGARADSSIFPWMCSGQLYHTEMTLITSALSLNAAVELPPIGGKQERKQNNGEKMLSESPLWLGKKRSAKEDSEHQNSAFLLSS